MTNTEEKDFTYEFIDDFDPSQIEYEKRKRWATTLEEFSRQDAKTVKFTLKTPKEKNLCRTAIETYKKAHGLDWTVFPEKNKYNIYVCKS